MWFVVARAGAGKVDGCALFFLRARFTLLEKYVIEFNDAAMKESQKLKAAEMQVRVAGRESAFSGIAAPAVAALATVAVAVVAV